MAFDIRNVGGLGTGILGDVTISSTSTQVNSYANVTNVGALGFQVTIGTPSVGAFGGFTAGQDLLFHVTGCLSAETTNIDKYAFATAIAMAGNTLTLDKAVPIFDLTKYVCQVVTVPNFNNLAVNCRVDALAYDTTKKYGGILVAKAKGVFDLTNGMWITEAKGIPVLACLKTDGTPVAVPLKPSGIIMTNADLPTKLIMPVGAGIAVIIADTYKRGSTTRIGSTWDGSTGTPNTANTGGFMGSGNGPAGIGGNGGGGSYDGGITATTSTGGSGSTVHSFGGLPGYHGGPSYGDGVARQYYSGYGDAGATIMLLANNTINFSLACFSTGGYGGHGLYVANAFGGGGGGAGFGFIATNTANFPTNTTAYALDTLITNKSSLLTTSAPWDLTTWTSADGFTVLGNQPAGTDRRFVFKLPIATTGVRTYPISTNAVAGDTVTINSVTFTAVASGATGNQFNVGASTTTTATNLASVLNANTTINALYTATASTNIVTLTEKVSGGGNTPGTMSKTGTIVIGVGTVTTAVPSTGGYYKISGSGSVTLVSVPSQMLTDKSVLAEGNTAAELALTTNIPAFVGKLIYPSIAHIGPGDGSVVPTTRIAVNGKNSQDTITKTFDSGEIVLAATDVDVFSAAALVNNVGAASTLLKIAAKKSTGTWSDYVNLDQANTLRGSSIALRSICTVPSVASGASSTVQKVTVRHRSNDAAVSGQSAEIVMNTDDFSSGLQAGQTAAMRGVRALLKHDGFRDAGAKAWCSFRSQPKTRERIAVGIGNQGNRLTMILGVDDAQGVRQRDTGINHNTLQVWYGATPVDIDFNTEVSEIYGSPPDGVTVFASYSYGWEPEVWVQMEAGQTNPYNGTSSFATDYGYTIPNSATKAVGAVKFELAKPVGSLPAGYSIGTVTGKQQMVWVPHNLKRETIVITPSAGTVSWVYDEDSGIITFVGSNTGATLTLAADWVAETPVATGITACYVQSA